MRIFLFGYFQAAVFFAVNVMRFVMAVVGRIITNSGTMVK